MLIIREQQIQYFIAKDESELVELIAQIVREANAGRTADYEDKTLEKMVKISIERAKSHDLQNAEDIAAFVAVMFEIAPNFDEQEQIKAVFADTNFPPPERLLQLFERVPDKDWEKAENLYDANVWFPDKNSGENKSENIVRTVKSQRELVEKFTAEYEKSPSDDLKYKLDRETDILRHLTNAEKANPKDRAQKAAECAKKTALNRAVQQVS